MSAYEDGFKAGETGRPFWTNPHAYPHSNKYKSQAWMAGWMAGKQRLAGYSPERIREYHERAVETLGEMPVIDED